MIVGTPWMIAISLAVNLGSVAVIVGRSHPARCNQSGHSSSFIAIRAVDDCGSLHLLSDGAIIAVPANPLVYFADGRGLTFPIAKRERDYKELHWLPVTLRPVEKARAA